MLQPAIGNGSMVVLRHTIIFADPYFKPDNRKILKSKDRPEWH